MNSLILILLLAEVTDEQAIDVFRVTSKEDVDDDGVNYDELFRVRSRSTIDVLIVRLGVCVSELCGALTQCKPEIEINISSFFFLYLEDMMSFIGLPHTSIVVKKYKLFGRGLQRSLPK